MDAIHQNGSKTPQNDMQSKLPDKVCDTNQNDLMTEQSDRVYTAMSPLPTPSRSSTSIPNDITALSTATTSLHIDDTLSQRSKSFTGQDASMTQLSSTLSLGFKQPPSLASNQHMSRVQSGSTSSGPFPVDPVLLRARTGVKMPSYMPPSSSNVSQSGSSTLNGQFPPKIPPPTSSSKQPLSSQLSQLPSSQLSQLPTRSATFSSIGSSLPAIPSSSSQQAFLGANTPNNPGSALSSLTPLPHHIPMARPSSQSRTPALQSPLKPFTTQVGGMHTPQVSSPRANASMSFMSSSMTPRNAPTMQNQQQSQRNGSYPHKLSSNISSLPLMQSPSVPNTSSNTRLFNNNAGLLSPHGSVHMNDHYNSSSTSSSMYPSRTATMTDSQNLPYTPLRPHATGLLPLHPTLLPSYSTSSQALPLDIIPDPVLPRSLSLPLILGPEKPFELHIIPFDHVLTERHIMHSIVTSSPYTTDLTPFMSSNSSPFYLPVPLLQVVVQNLPHFFHSKTSRYSAPLPPYDDDDEQLYIDESKSMSQSSALTNPGLASTPALYSNNNSNNANTLAATAKRDKPRQLCNIIDVFDHSYASPPAPYQHHLPLGIISLFRQNAGSTNQLLPELVTHNDFFDFYTHLDHSRLSTPVYTYPYEPPSLWEPDTNQSLRLLYDCYNLPSPTDLIMVATNQITRHDIRQSILTHAMIANQVYFNIPNYQRIRHPFTSLNRRGSSFSASSLGRLHRHDYISTLIPILPYPLEIDEKEVYNLEDIPVSTQTRKKKKRRGGGGLKTKKTEDTTAQSSDPLQQQTPSMHDNPGDSQHDTTANNANNDAATSPPHQNGFLLTDLSIIPDTNHIVMPWGEPFALDADEQDGGRKGLRYYSHRVSLTLQQAGDMAGYTEISDQLVKEMTLQDPSIGIDNLRRRIYDAFNVLVALGCVKKSLRRGARGLSGSSQNQHIIWQGLRTNVVLSGELQNGQTVTLSDCEALKMVIIRQIQHIQMQLITLLNIHKIIQINKAYTEAPMITDRYELKLASLKVDALAQTPFNTESVVNRYQRRQQHHHNSIMAGQLSSSSSSSYMDMNDNDNHDLSTSFTTAARQQILSVLNREYHIDESDLATAVQPGTMAANPRSGPSISHVLFNTLFEPSYVAKAEEISSQSIENNKSTSGTGAATTQQLPLVFRNHPRGVRCGTIIKYAPSVDHTDFSDSIMVAPVVLPPPPPSSTLQPPPHALFHDIHHPRHDSSSDIKHDANTNTNITTDMNDNIVTNTTLPLSEYVPLSSSPHFSPSQHSLSSNSLLSSHAVTRSDRSSSSTITKSQRSFSPIRPHSRLCQLPLPTCAPMTATAHSIATSKGSSTRGSELPSRSVPFQPSAPQTSTLTAPRMTHSSALIHHSPITSSSVMTSASAERSNLGRGKSRLQNDIDSSSHQGSATSKTSGGHNRSSTGLPITSSEFNTPTNAESLPGTNTKPRTASPHHGPVSFAFAIRQRLDEEGGEATGSRPTSRKNTPTRNDSLAGPRVVSRITQAPATDRYKSDFMMNGRKSSYPFTTSKLEKMSTLDNNNNNNNNNNSASTNNENKTSIESSSTAVSVSPMQPFGCLHLPDNNDCNDNQLVMDVTTTTKSPSDQGHTLSNGPHSAAPSQCNGSARFSIEGSMSAHEMALLHEMPLLDDTDNTVVANGNSSLDPSSHQSISNGIVITTASLLHAAVASAPHTPRLFTHRIVDHPSAQKHDSDDKLIISSQCQIIQTALSNDNRTMATTTTTTTDDNNDDDTTISKIMTSDDDGCGTLVGKNENDDTHPPNKDTTLMDDTNNDNADDSTTHNTEITQPISMSEQPPLDDIPSLIDTDIVGTKHETISPPCEIKIEDDIDNHTHSSIQCDIIKTECIDSPTPSHILPSPSPSQNIVHGPEIGCQYLLQPDLDFDKDSFGGNFAVCVVHNPTSGTLSKRKSVPNDDQVRDNKRVFHLDPPCVNITERITVDPITQTVTTTTVIMGQDDATMALLPDQTVIGHMNLGNSYVVDEWVDDDGQLPGFFKYYPIGQWPSLVVSDLTPIHQQYHEYAQNPSDIVGYAQQPIDTSSLAPPVFEHPSGFICTGPSSILPLVSPADTFPPAPTVVKSALDLVRCTKGYRKSALNGPPSLELLNDNDDDITTTENMTIPSLDYASNQPFNSPTQAHTSLLGGQTNITRFPPLIHNNNMISLPSALGLPPQPRPKPPPVLMTQPALTPTFGPTSHTTDSQSHQTVNSFLSTPARQQPPSSLARAFQLPGSRQANTSSHLPLTGTPLPHTVQQPSLNRSQAFGSQRPPPSSAVTGLLPLPNAATMGLSTPRAPNHSSVPSLAASKAMLFSGLTPSLPTSGFSSTGDMATLNSQVDHIDDIPQSQGSYTNLASSSLMAPPGLSAGLLASQQQQPSYMTQTLQSQTFQSQTSQTSYSNVPATISGSSDEATNTTTTHEYNHNHTHTRSAVTALNRNDHSAWPSKAPRHHHHQQPIINDNNNTAQYDEPNVENTKPLSRKAPRAGQARTTRSRAQIEEQEQDDLVAYQKPNRTGPRKRDAANSSLDSTTTLFTEQTRSSSSSAATTQIGADGNPIKRSRGRPKKQPNPPLVPVPNAPLPPDPSRHPKPPQHPSQPLTYHRQTHDSSQSYFTPLVTQSTQNSTTNSRTTSNLLSSQNATVYSTTSLFSSPQVNTNNPPSNGLFSSSGHDELPSQTGREPNSRYNFCNGTPLPSASSSRNNRLMESPLHSGTIPSAFSPFHTSMGRPAHALAPYLNRGGAPSNGGDPFLSTPHPQRSISHSHGTPLASQQVLAQLQSSMTNFNRPDSSSREHD